MKFSPLTLPGAWLVALELKRDRRGYFARCFDAEKFRELGLETAFEQHSLSFNHVRGTLRGLHYQVPPYDEVKLVRCTRGRLYDVLVDLRRGSSTYGKWAGYELSADEPGALYIPAGLAHGFITLEDETEVHYMIHGPYKPEAARTIRWDDPALAIDWPMTPVVISDNDRNAPPLGEDAQ